MFMLGVTASKIGSVALANILYNMDTFNVDVSNLRTIDNADVSGETYDASMYGSNHIYLGATQSVDYVTVNTGDYAYFDVTTKAHVKATATGATTTISTPTHHSNFFSLKAGVSISAGDLTALNANPEDIARMVNSVATVGTYSFTLADIEAFYPGNEGSDGGAYIQDIATDISAELHATMDTALATGDEISSYTKVSETAFDLAITTAGTNSARPLMGNSWSASIGVIPILTFNATVTSGTPIITSIVIGGVANTINHTIVNGVNTIVLKPTTTTGGESIYWNGTNLFDISITGWSIVAITSFSTITNYTADCRTTYLNTNYGASNFLYTQDTSGRLTGMHTSGHIKSGTDGRNITIAMTTPYNHVVTKDIDKIEGNLTSCTITYSDATTIVVP